MNKLIRTLPLLLILALVGCSKTNYVVSPASPTSDSIPLQLSITLTIKPSQTTVPDILPVLGPPPPGLIYCSNKSLWATQTDGSTIYLVPDCRAIFSSDFRYVLFDGFEDHFVLTLNNGEVIGELGLWDTENDPRMEYAERLGGATWSKDSSTIFYELGSYSGLESDIWSFDIQTGIKTNLSNTDNRLEGWPKLFDGETKLIFSSRLIEENWPYFFGYLTLMNPEGSEYLVYSEEDNSGFKEVSPDGDAAAIFGGNLFDTEQIFTTQSPKILNKDPDLSYQLYDPAWSPNNQQIGWSVEIIQDQNRYYGFGIQDLAENTIRLLFPFLLMDGEGFPMAPEWSPDNNWLSFYSPNNESGKLGLYIIKVDGTEEYFFEEYVNVVWNPIDENVFLITGNFYGPSTQGAWITSLGDSDRIKLDLPQDAVVIDWIDPDHIENWIGFDQEKVYWQE